MNTRQNAINKIEEFLVSEKKIALVTGTHQYNKHKLVMAILDNRYKDKVILFRTSSLDNLTNNDFLGFADVKTKPKAGAQIKIHNNYYQIDNFNRKDTWSKTSAKADFAIVYPIDALIRNNNFDSIENLIKNKNIGKIFLVSWMDNDIASEELRKLYSNHVIYDAEEEDPSYHSRVLMSLR
ncbi:hypothetical protein SDC9_59481 [bioreactor metagenome]|jgi:hypothetical protein|uniref:Uncharacterized protein n=1 Tax=bioreactor metagenome TaxID=1076179 RepID=A0A644XA87_9ZZZZ|nr:hypothetical protein [Dysgonamonadaceae bacterium]